MMRFRNLQLNINIEGKGEQAIIILHGWGQNLNSFYAVRKHLKAYFTVYSVDLPGFGLSDKPDYPYNTADYAQVIKAVVDYYNLESPIIIGHSFGGRVAIKYTALYDNIRKLVLVDSAGIVRRKTLKYFFKVYSYKFCKVFFKLPGLKIYRNRVLNRFGSSDYKQADEIMKQVLVKVVNEDLRSDLAKIACPTLLIWGTNDYVTPLKDAYLMKEFLKDAGIAEIKGAGHFSYLDNLPLFLKILDVFFTNDKQGGML